MKTCVVIALVLSVIVSLYGCASLQQQLAATAAMEAKSRAAFKFNCYMGRIESITVLSNGPGRFTLELDGDECDGKDRT